jgi:TRAP-type C4-dicarboxylate transport system substrate-binding protein
MLPEFDAFKVLALHADSGGVLHTRHGPVTRLEDLQGLRLRCPAGPMTAALTALGAVPIPLLPPQIHDAVRTGLVDGAVMAWDVVAYTRTAAMLPFHTDTRLYVSPLYFVMNRARYDGLAAPLRSAIDAVSGDALVRQFPGWWHAWERPGRRLAEAPGQTISVLSADELDRWRDAAAPAIAAHLTALRESGVTGAHDLYAAATALRRRTP